MGLGSLFSKAIAKQAVKAADEVVPVPSLVQPRRVIAEEVIPTTPIQQREPLATRINPERREPVVPAPEPIQPRVDTGNDLGTEPELIAKEGKNAFEALNITPEKTEQWKKVNRVKQRSSLLPEIEEAAEKLYNKQITSDEFQTLSKEKQPIKSFEKVPEMPSFEDIANALSEKQVNAAGIVGVNLKLKEGTKVASRLDIPAYNNFDTWIVSLHDGTKKAGKVIGYAKTAVLKNVVFDTDSKVALDIARRKQLSTGERMGKATIARIYGDWIPHDPLKAKQYAEKVMKSDEWTQVGMNPYRASYFYDKATGLPVVSAEEVIQVGPLVLAKRAKTTTPKDPRFLVNPADPNSPTFNKGGMMKPSIPGFQDGGNAVEPTTGNEVPVGSLPNEVADDIPAKLSEGEFVLPADVVRFIGLERLMKLRDDAKEGLRRMSEIGQMGNAEDVGEKADDSFEEGEEGEEEEDNEGFESDIDDILSEIDSVEGQTEQAFAQGGVVGGAPWLTGFDLKKAPKNPVFDVRYYKHSDGRIMYVTFFNGKPMTPIPDGFSQTEAPVEQQVGKEAEAKKAEEQKQTQMPDVGGGIGADSGGAGVDVGAVSRGDESALATGTTVSSGAVKGAAAIGALMGIPGALAVAKNAENIANALSMASGKLAGQQNIDAVGKAFGFDTSTAEGKAAASSVIDSMSARAGSPLDQVSTSQGGRGGAAASAGASAASQASAIGLDSSAQGRASRDAANAVLAGADPTSAAQAAVDKEAAAVAQADYAESGAAGVGSGYGSDAGFGDGSGLGYKKGGLVSKPTKARKPLKKTKGKGLASR